MYSAEAKKELKQALETEAEGLKGEQMIYTLVEWLKEQLVHYAEISKRSLRQVSRTFPKILHFVFRKKNLKP